MSFAPGLAALALRRALSPAVLGLALALGALAVTTHWAPSGELLELAGADRGGSARGLARRGVWALFAAVAVPWFVYRAAATAAEWRGREVDWLGALPLSRRAALASLGAGIAVAALLACALGAAAAELAAARHAATGEARLRPVQRLQMVPTVLTEPGERARWSIESHVGAFEGAKHVRATFALAGGGPATEVRMTLRRGGSERAATAWLSAGRASLLAPVPAGEGAVELTFTKGAGTAVAVLVPDGLELLREVPVAAWPSAAIALRVFLASAALAAVALGLGAWMNPGLATLLALAVALAGWIGGGLGPAWPASDLPAALGHLGEGLLPKNVGVGAWAVASGLALLGWAAAARGLRGGREPR